MIDGIHRMRDADGTWAHPTPPLHPSIYLNESLLPLPILDPSTCHLPIKSRACLSICLLSFFCGAPGEEDLKWLPLEYPGNVRLIVSTTNYPEEGAEAGAAGRRNKSLIELRRRQWDLMEVKELSNKARKEILMSYLRVSTWGMYLYIVRGGWEGDGWRAIKC